MRSLLIRELPLYYALQFAIVKHAGQKRGKLPYVTHCIDVAAQLLELGVRDVSVIAAALLHDVVEDTGTPLSEINNQFGERVTQLVEWLTLPEEAQNDRERKRQHQISMMKVMDVEGMLIKICDKADNVAGLVFDPPNWSPDRKQAYVDDASAVVGVAVNRVRAPVSDPSFVADVRLQHAVMKFSDVRMLYAAHLRDVRSCGCGAVPGTFHIPGCDVERCARCGGQAISCACVYEVNGMSRDSLEEQHPEIYSNGPTPAMEEVLEKLYPRLPWLGVWPGVIECEEYDLWCVGPPWTPSSKTAPGAGHDLNRLQRDTYWDPLARRMYR